MDPGERRDEMVTGRMELGWLSGDRDTAGAAGGDGDWDAAPKEQKRCCGKAPPGVRSDGKGHLLVPYRVCIQAVLPRGILGT